MDLYTIQKVNKQFHKLATDHVLWIYFFFKRYSVQLEKMIVCRRTRRELIQANIMKGFSTQVMIQKIERGEYIGDATTAQFYNVGILLHSNRNRRILNERIHYRPEYTELLNRNVIQTVNPSIAPNLHSKINELQKKLKRDKVKRLLSTRQSILDLRNQGILIFDGSVCTSTSIVALQKKVSLGLIRKDLYRKIQYRMTAQVLERKKIVPERVTAPLLCPSIRSKIQFYEQHCA
jgi:hypothetical protein